MKAASFLLIKTRGNAHGLVNKLTKRREEGVIWSLPIYGPYQVICYIEQSSYPEMERYVEMLREEPEFQEIDARRVKPIPEDLELASFTTSAPEVAALLIRVDYRIQRERDLTLQLRRINGVTFARAMWGPDDIIALVEAQNPEEMRNLICDDIKVIPSVSGNVTLYGYAG